MLYIALNIILKRLFNVSLSLNKMIKLFATTGFIICITFASVNAFNSLYAYQDAYLKQVSLYLQRLQ